MSYARRWALSAEQLRGIQSIDQTDRVSIILKTFAASWLGYYYPQHMLIYRPSETKNSKKGDS